MDIPVPIKGSIPIDFSFPLKQNMGIQGDLFLHVTEPLPVTIRKELEVPVNLVVKGVLPVDEEITVPIETNMEGQIGIPGQLPCTVEFQMGPEDWGKGIRISH